MEKGIRDYGSSGAALNRHLQTFGGEDLYKNDFEKAAAVTGSIILNHPFVDGNKRTAYMLCEALLRNDGYKTNAEVKDNYDFVVNISAGNTAFEQIVTWLQQHTEPFQFLK